MRQEMVVIGNEWNFGCCAERREFSIVRIFDEGKVVGIDTAAKLSLWTKESANLSQRRVGIRRKTNSVSRRVGSFQIN
jgi:hypothetical protein